MKMKMPTEAVIVVIDSDTILVVSIEPPIRD